MFTWGQREPAGAGSGERPGLGEEHVVTHEENDRRRAFRPASNELCVVGSRRPRLVQSSQEGL